MRGGKVVITTIALGTANKPTPVQNRPRQCSGFHQPIAAQIFSTPAPTMTRKTGTPKRMAVTSEPLTTTCGSSFVPASRIGGSGVADLVSSGISDFFDYTIR